MLQSKPGAKSAENDKHGIATNAWQSGRVYFRSGQKEKAREMYRQSLEGSERQGTPEASADHCSAWQRSWQKEAIWRKLCSTSGLLIDGDRES